MLSTHYTLKFWLSFEYIEKNIMEVFVILKVKLSFVYSTKIMSKLIFAY